jgi:hypothetical protein
MGVNTAEETESDLSPRRRGEHRDYAEKIQSLLFFSALSQPLRGSAVNGRCRPQIANPVKAMMLPAIPAIRPISGNMVLLEIKNIEVSTRPISSSPSPKS